MNNSDNEYVQKVLHHETLLELRGIKNAIIGGFVSLILIIVLVAMYR